MVVQYDGTRYKGWQRLGNTDNTIQQKIEKVISKMIGEDIQIIGSGRTDAGVHAKGQIANFYLDTNMLDVDIMNYLNQYLPDDIVIASIEEVEERFHSRYNAKRKKYVYSIVNGKIKPVFDRKYVYYIDEKLDISKMKKATKYLIGENDFKAFTAMKSKKKSTVREIYDINIIQNGDRVDIVYVGNGFLHKMIRIITGTLIEVGLGNINEDTIPKIMKGKVRANAGVTAPAQGLCLEEVFY